MCNADQNLITRWATHDRPHTVHVDSQRTNNVCLSAICACCLNKCHLKRKDFVEDAPGGTAIQLIVYQIHHASPVGPNRSVLIRSGSYPSATRFPAALSTNGVGPQINTTRSSSGGHDSSCSRAAAIRPRSPVHPGGWARVRVYDT